MSAFGRAPGPAPPMPFLRPNALIWSNPRSLAEATRGRTGVLLGFGE
jgi:hypothetical protein